jgi:succinate dehydrogenase/fumarate reductase flavoprotein subunit
MLYDVVVVGSGIAGLSAAIKAADSGKQVLILTKNMALRSNSSMAAGGINAALGNMEPDTAALHLADTLKGADGLASQKAATVLTKNAVNTVIKLDAIGADFDKYEGGKILQRSFGGAGKKRTCFVADKTGGAIVQALLLSMKGKNIRIQSDYLVMSLLKDDDRIAGVSALNKKTCQIELFGAKSVVLAGGGYGGVYFGHTSNPQDSVGDLLAVAMRAGLSVRDMEFTQFHPTGLWHTGSLVSEAVRGEGGYIVDKNGKRFTNELATRDVLARAIARQMEEGGVYIDVRHIDPEILVQRVPSFLKAAMAHEGKDATKELVPIKPVAHYTMGGIAANEKCETAIKGLYAAGECACNGVHGANRLGGNSLLEAAVFGNIAGEEAALYVAKQAEYPKIDLTTVAKDEKRVENILKGEAGANPRAVRKSLGDTLYAKAGLFRDEHGLSSAYEYIGYLKSVAGMMSAMEKKREGNFEVPLILELQNAALVAEATVLAALKREESRGAHFRDDFGVKDDNKFKKHSLVRLEGMKLVHSYEESGFFGKIKQFIKK